MPGADVVGISGLPAPPLPPPRLPPRSPPLPPAAPGAKSCREWYNQGSTASGFYVITPDPLPASKLGELKGTQISWGSAAFPAAIKVYCDMDPASDGGPGWTLLGLYSSTNSVLDHWSQQSSASAPETGPLCNDAANGMNPDNIPCGDGTSGQCVFSHSGYCFDNEGRFDPVPGCNVDGGSGCSVGATGTVPTERTSGFPTTRLPFAVHNAIAAQGTDATSAFKATFPQGECTTLYWERKCFLFNWDDGSAYCNRNWGGFAHGTGVNSQRRKAWRHVAHGAVMAYGGQDGYSDVGLELTSYQGTPWVCGGHANGYLWWVM